MPVGRARREPVTARTAWPSVVAAWRQQFVERADGWCCSVDAAIGNRDEEWIDVEP
jgi:hypothetical protein